MISWNGLHILDAVGRDVKGRWRRILAIRLIGRLPRVLGRWVLSSTHSSAIVNGFRGLLICGQWASSKNGVWGVLPCSHWPAIVNGFQRSSPVSILPDLTSDRSFSSDRKDRLISEDNWVGTVEWLQIIWPWVIFGISSFSFESRKIPATRRLCMNLYELCKPRVRITGDFL